MGMSSTDLLYMLQTRPELDYLLYIIYIYNNYYPKKAKFKKISEILQESYTKL